MRLVVDYALDRVLGTGKRARKVFKLAQVALSPGESRELQGRQRLRQLSTRTYYPGRHVIEVLVNGQPRGSAEFDLEPA